MSRLPRLLAPVVVSVVGAVVLLSGCTSAPTGPAATSPSSSSTSASSPSTSASSPSSPSTSSTPSTTAPAADSVTVDITIRDGQVTPNGDKVDVTKGQTVVLNVTSDSDDEIHAHTSGDGYELEVKAGTPATGELVATDTGTFEVESHHLEKVIVRLVVR